MDDWTSLANRRYMNVNIHTAGVHNLGLFRVMGSYQAEKCLEMLREKLQDFGIDLEKHVVGITSDGANLRSVWKGAKALFQGKNRASVWGK